MDISLDLYKIYCTVVRTGNMSLAAKELFISQPAVSMAIKQLEEKLNSPLLIRTAKGVRPTNEGQVLYEYLSRALGLISTAEKKYLEMINLEAGELKIGAGDTVLNHFVLPYLEKFNRDFPQIKLKIINKTSYECLKNLRSGKIDICFINLPIKDSDDLEITKCLKVNDCLVGGTKFKHLAKTGININNLENYPLLMLEEMSNSRLFVNDFATKNGVNLKPNIELGSFDLLLSFAKINLGLSFVTKELTSNAIDNETLFEIPLNPPIPSRYIGIAKLKNVALSTAAKEFFKMFDLVQ